VLRLVILSVQSQEALAKLEASNAAAEKLQVVMCQALLQSILAASRLPEAWQARIRQDFTDMPFEPKHFISGSKTIESCCPPPSLAARSRA